MTKQNRNVAINQFLVNLYEFRRELRIILATYMVEEGWESIQDFCIFKLIQTAVLL